MKCTICQNGQMKDGKVTVTLQREDIIIVVKQVSVKACKIVENMY